MVEGTESAVAVVVVDFAGSVAVGVGAESAGAGGAVGEGFAGVEGLAWRGDFLSFRGGDDALDMVFGVGVGEGSGLEVDGGGAVGGDHGVGLPGLEPAIGEGGLDEVEVALDGEAVLGELEGDGCGVGPAGAGGEAPLAEVAVAEVEAGEGWGLAGVSGGHDVPAERIWHGGLRGSGWSKWRGRESQACDSVRVTACSALSSRNERG